MGKTVPMASFRRATRPTAELVEAFVDLGDAEGDTPVRVVEEVGADVNAGVDTPGETIPGGVVESASAAARSLPAGVGSAKLEVAKARPGPRWRRKTMLRADGRELRKQTFYLDAELSHRLMVTCASIEYDLSEAIEEGVNLWLKAKG
jgi:hypothetical protein